MGQKPQILVDTDILIKTFRGDSKKRKLLNANKGKLAISIVTYLELLSGLKTKQRIIDLNKQMNAYTVVHISENISQKSLSLFQKYISKHSLSPADTLIASTAIINRLELFTDNIEDYIFIKELKLFKQ